MLDTIEPNIDVQEASEPSVLWKLFGLDIRSLAFLRIGLGIILLLDLAIRAFSMTAHYTDAGTLSRVLRRQMALGETYVTPPWNISLHMLSGSLWWQAVLFTIAALAATAMLIGYRTRIATMITWFLLVSLHARNPSVLNGGDDILRCSLFWAMLLPLGAAWSWDAKQKRKNQQSNLESGEWHGRIVSFASAGLILQLYCMYWFTALLKWAPSWRVDMTAVHYALSYDHFTTRIGYWLLEWPQLLWALTLGTIILEFLGPCLLLLPIGNRKLRIAIPLAFIGLHVGLGITMRLGLFPPICAVLWCMLLPGEVWESVAVRFKKRSELLRLYSPKPSTAEKKAVPNWPHIGVQVLAGYCILFMAWQNIARMQNGNAVDLPNGLIRLVGRSAQLNQYWPMFSPGPPEYGGWLVIKGTLRDGCEVNLFHPRCGMEDRRPELISSTYPNQRWRKHLMSLFERPSPCSRRGTCDYLVRRWNESHGPDRQVDSAEILVVVEPTPPPMSDIQPEPNSIVVVYACDYSGNSGAGVSTDLTSL